MISSDLKLFATVKGEGNEVCTNIETVTQVLLQN